MRHLSENHESLTVIKGSEKKLRLITEQASFKRIITKKDKAIANFIF